MPDSGASALKALMVMSSLTFSDQTRCEAPGGSDDGRQNRARIRSHEVSAADVDQDGGRLGRRRRRRGRRQVDDARKNIDAHRRRGNFVVVVDVGRFDKKQRSSW